MHVKKDYDALKKDYDVATANLTSAQREYATLQTQLAALQKESDTTKATLQAQIDSQTATIAQGSNAPLPAKSIEYCFGNPGKIRLYL